MCFIDFTFLVSRHLQTCCLNKCATIHMSILFTQRILANVASGKILSRPSRQQLSNADVEHWAPRLNCTHLSYLIVYLLVNISLDSIKIKLLKFNPLIQPPVDCKFRTFKQNQQTWISQWTKTSQITLKLTHFCTGTILRALNRGAMFPFQLKTR